MVLRELERALDLRESFKHIISQLMQLLTCHSIANTSRSWGDMIREYGNSVKDMTGAAGTRATTKGNPLGLSTGGAGGAASMASRPGYSSSKPKTGSASNPLGL